MVQVSVSSVPNVARSVGVDSHHAVPPYKYVRWQYLTPVSVPCWNGYCQPTSQADPISQCIDHRYCGVLKLADCNELCIGSGDTPDFGLFAETHVRTSVTDRYLGQLRSTAKTQHAGESRRLQNAVTCCRCATSRYIADRKRVVMGKSNWVGCGPPERVGNACTTMPTSSIEWGLFVLDRWNSLLITSVMCCPVKPTLASNPIEASRKVLRMELRNAAVIVLAHNRFSGRYNNILLFAVYICQPVVRTLRDCISAGYLGATIEDNRVSAKGQFKWFLQKRNEAQSFSKGSDYSATYQSGSGARYELNNSYSYITLYSTGECHSVLEIRRYSKIPTQIKKKIKSAIQTRKQIKRVIMV